MKTTAILAGRCHRQDRVFISFCAISTALLIRPHSIDDIVSERCAYQGTDGLVEGGFTFRTSAALFYGQQVKGIVKILGVKMIEKAPAENKGIAHSFQSFMATYHLYLVDWCKPQLITANVETIDKFLAS